MAFWAATRPRNPITLFAQRWASPTARGSASQWVIAGVVGIALGGSVLAVSSLSQRWGILLLLAVLSPFVVMIVGNVRRLLLAVILLDIPFQLDVYLFYQEKAGNLGAVGGLNISVTTLALAALYALWLADLLARVDSPPRAWFRVSLPLISYVAIVTLSVVVARDVNLVIFEVFLLVQSLLLFIYIVGTVRAREDVLFIVTMLLVGLALQSLVMIGLRLIGHSITVANITARIDSGSRVGGTIGTPNSAASYLSLLLAPALSLVLTQVGRGYKLLAVLAFSLGAIALVFTLSRGGWVAFGLSAIILITLAWHRGWLSPSVPLALVAVALLLFLLFQDTIIARLVGDDNGSAYARVPLMQIAFRMIKDYPLLGIGSNNFAATVAQYVTPEFSREWIYTVHNNYLLVWAETGTGALVAFVWFLMATVHRGWQGARLNDRLLSPLALGFTAAIAGHMVHMLVDFFNQRPEVQLLWLIAGLITAMYITSVFSGTAADDSGATHIE